MKVSVIVPVYNEQRTVVDAVQRMAAVQIPSGDTEAEKEIVIVDDGSTDGTRDILREHFGDRAPGIRLILAERNQGKGAALRTGFAAATGDIVVVQDADLEYDARDLPRLLAPIIEGVADVVYGSRLSGGMPQRVYLFWHHLGNRLLSFLTNLLYNTTLTDMETGSKAFRIEVLRRMQLRSNGFEIEPELTAKVFKMGCRVYEIPICYYGRSYGEGKKIRWYHALGAFWTILRFRLFD